MRFRASGRAAATDTSVISYIIADAGIIAESRASVAISRRADDMAFIASGTEVE